MIARTALLLASLGWAVEAQADPAALGRARFAPVLAEEAARQGLPAVLADAVATVESGYDPGARGGSGEVGLMQVLPSTAEMLGFHGTDDQLADPRTNIGLGVAYLAGAWRATGGRLCDTLMKYRAGYGQSVMTQRSVDYCRRARSYLASIGSPLSEGPGTELPAFVPDAAIGNGRGRLPLLLTRAEVVRMRHGQRTAEDSERYWIAEEARIRFLRAHFQARR